MEIIRGRYLYQSAVLLVAILFLMMHTCPEIVFTDYRSSLLEEALEEGEMVTLTGTIYKKEQKESQVLLYLKSLSYDGKVIPRERVLVRISNDTYEKAGRICYGNLIKVKGKVKHFEGASNPGSFDQKFYYQKQRIHLELSGGEVLSFTGSADKLRESLWRMKVKGMYLLVDTLGEEKGSILSSMIFGSSIKSSEEKELYQKSGIGHIFAISGLHVALIGFGVYRLLKSLPIPLWAARLLTGAWMIFYLVLTGGGTSSFRAVTMFLLRLLAEQCGRQYDGLTALSVAAILTLLWEPLLLFDAGFLLSYGAIIGIYLVLPTAQKLLPEKGKFITMPLAGSLAVQVTLIPVMLYYYYEYSVWSVFWNILVIPIAGWILGAGCIGTVFLYLPLSLFHTIGNALVSLAGIGLWFYGKGSRILLYLPFARIICGRPGFMQLIIYFASMNLLWYLAKHRKLRLRVVLSASVLITLILIVPGKISRETYLTMLDVGQGDCFILKNNNGTLHMIDCGSSSVSNVGRYRIEPYLRYMGEGAVDYLWISHGDEDHMNAALELMDRKLVGVKIQNLMLPPKEYWNENLQELARKASECGVAVYEVRAGNTYQDGQMRIHCLWPEKNREDSYSDNEASVVLGVRMQSSSILFTGDLELQGEEALVRKLKKEKQKYAILKCGHHGSKNATSDELLQVVKPKVALISAGKENRYGHPHKETIERLKEYGCKIVSTQENGAVSLE